eukprot:TRINITY_DN68311_c0_g1_i1.p1 TRINITY_DN68311_c0_g1~~TRINITY_DN68311_c0_g1_i1.p1  ORF type:complete len:518 (+),score=23.85 TRINITY_DN68311_c0_g1_i1:213-1556(+)
MDAGWLTGRLGPHVTLALGSLSMLVGSISIWASVHSGWKVPYEVLLLSFWLFGHGLGYLDNAGISTSVRNFSNHMGTAVGLMKALEGITSAVMGMAFYTFFSAPSGLSEYPLLLAIAALVVGLISTPIMTIANEPSIEADVVVARKFKVLMAGLLCFVLLSAVIVTQKLYCWTTFGLSITMLCSMFLLVLPMRSDDMHSSGHSASPPARAIGSSRPNLSVGRMLRTLDFYLIFFVMFVTQGVGIMFSNNLAQIDKALSMDGAADSGLLVAVFSVANTSGRILYGYGSEAIRGKVNRPWFLGMSCLLITTCMVLMHFGQSTLVLVSALMGVSLGGTFALQAVIIEEVFGPTDLPLKYSCCFVAACIGSMVFSDFLVGRVYDAAAAAQGRSICLGGACFAVTTYVCAIAGFVAFVCSITFSYRSRNAYSCLGVTSMCAEQENAWLADAH